MLNTSQDDHLVIGLSMKHNVMTKFLFLNLGYTDHAIPIFRVYEICHQATQIIKDRHLMFSFSTKMEMGRLK